VPAGSYGVSVKNPFEAYMQAADDGDPGTSEITREFEGDLPGVRGVVAAATIATVGSVNSSRRASVLQVAYSTVGAAGVWVRTSG